MCCGWWQAAAAALILGVWAIHEFQSGKASPGSALLGVIAILVSVAILLINLLCASALHLGPKVAHRLDDRRPVTRAERREPDPRPSHTTVVRVNSNGVDRAPAPRGGRPNRIIVQQSQSVRIE